MEPCMDKCYLCRKEVDISSNNFKVVQIGVGFDDDSVYMCDDCFVIAPWNQLMEESNIEMFVSTANIPQGTKTLDDFPNRMKYGAGTPIVDIMNGKKAVRATITPAVST